MDWLEKAPEAQAAEKPENTQAAAKQNKPAALPESKEAKKPVTTKGGNGGGNGFVTGQVLFAKLNKYGIPTKQYMDYACKRYSVESFTDLIEEQIKEQEKLLDSMVRPERLKEFKELLTGRKLAESMPPVPVIPANTQPAEAFNMF